MHCFVSQHGLTHNISNSEDMVDIGTHLLIDRNKAAFIQTDTSSICINLLTIWSSTNGYQDQIIELWSSGCFLTLKAHLDPIGFCFSFCGACFKHDVVKAMGIHLLPNLFEITISACHEAIHHLSNVKARAKSAIHRCHL